MGQFQSQTEKFVSVQTLRQDGISLRDSGNPVNDQPRRPEIVGSEESLLHKTTYGLTLLFIFAIPWENVVIIPGVGTLAKIVAALLLSVWLLSMAVSGRFRPIHFLHFWIHIFLTWAICTAIWSYDFDFSRVRIVTLGQLILLTLVYWNVLRNRAQIGHALQAYVFGSCVTVGILIFNYLTGNVSQWESRATIANSNENSIGILVAIALPMAWYLAIQGPTLFGSPRWLQLTNFAYVPLGLIGVMLTASRSSFLATLPFVVSIPLITSQMRTKYRVLSILAMVVLIWLAYLYTPESSISRIMTIQSQFEQRDLNQRFDLWTRGFEFLTASPTNILSGAGIGNYPIIAGKDAHNTFLSILVEMGIFGLLVYVIMLGIVAKVILSLARFDERILWGTVSSIWLLGNLAGTWLFYKFSWLVLLLVVCHATANAMNSPLSDEKDESFMDPAEPKTSRRNEH